MWACVGKADASVWKPQKIDRKAGGKKEGRLEVRQVAKGSQEARND